MHIPTVFAVTEASQVGEVRRAGANLARHIGLGEPAGNHLALVLTELATNLVKHARDGEMLLRPLEDGKALGVEVLALDKGPGMPDVARCLRDGFSTAGSPGTGLGAVVRLSTFTDIYSRSPSGTALVARLWSEAPRARAEGLHHAAVSVPKPGEQFCGDSWAVEQAGPRKLVLVADGLGHGLHAAEASQAAARIFRASLHLGLVEILQAMHRGLRSTRGAAVSLAEVDLTARVVRYAGIGNVAGCILSGALSRSMVTHNGTVGHETRHFQEFTYPFPPGSLLVMNSDGLTSRWALDPYPGLAARDPALVAGVLYRDFQRGRDDVTVVVAREEESGP